MNLSLEDNLEKMCIMFSEEEAHEWFVASAISEVFLL